MVGIIEHRGVKMVQTIGEYVEQDATFWTNVDILIYNLPEEEIEAFNV